MYIDQSTNSVVDETKPVSEDKIVKTLGVKPTTEIISEEKIRIMKDGSALDSVLYIAKGE